jgi:formylglycine-generating enzyme required for sulfatase activity
MFLAASLAVLAAVAAAPEPSPAVAAVRVTQSRAATAAIPRDLAETPPDNRRDLVACLATDGGDQVTAIPTTPSMRSPRRRILRQSRRRPEELVVMLPGEVPLELVRIAGGMPFMMGASAEESVHSEWERPQHLVTIAQDYYLGKYEVTQAQWTAVMGTNPARGYGVGGTWPVYGVSWNNIAGAGGFIERLNQALGTATFRLPTEAEWEYAARGGTTTEFSFPAPASWDRGCGSFPAAEPYMWWCGEFWHHGTMEIGLKLPNPMGLFDMHGNVLEWVQDRFHDNFTDAPTDGSAWEVGPASYRAVRSGAWNEPAAYCRSAMRLRLDPGHQCFNLGFRIASSAP